MSLSTPPAEPSSSPTTLSPAEELLTWIQTLEGRLGAAQNWIHQRTNVYCPECGRYQAQHAPSCRVPALLAKPSQLISKSD